MSDDEFDDLPSISVSSVSRESSWSMPSANELATERQREQQVEDELRALRIQMAPSTITMTAAPPRSDSSGSEGEAALAAAASALRVQVQPTRPPPAPKDPPGCALLQRFVPELTAMELAYMDALKGTQSELAKFTESIMVTIGSCDHPSTWDRDTRVPILRLLCAAAVSRAGLRARRALHHVLDATPNAEIKELVRKMEGADTGMMITLCDSARGGGGGGELFAALLLRQTLVTLAGDSVGDIAAHTAEDVITPDEISALLFRCNNSKLPTKTRHMAVQLTGRLLAVTGARHLPADGSTTSVMRPNSAAPEQLRLALAQAKLQLLFRGNEKNSQNSHSSQ